MLGLHAGRTAESDVGGARVRRERHAGRHPVAVAGELVAHEGAALFHLVVARRWPLRIDLVLGVVLPRVPVVCPLPYIAHCVEEAVFVGGIGAHRCCQLVAVLCRVLRADGEDERLS